MKTNETKWVNVRMPPRVHRALKAEAKRRKWSLHATILDLLKSK